LPSFFYGLVCQNYYYHKWRAIAFIAQVSLFLRYQQFKRIEAIQVINEALLSLKIWFAKSVNEMILPNTHDTYSMQTE